MNKKILIGSIIAVAILVGVSFTTVVGYSSVKSTSGEASPLFNIRAKRAINQDDDSFSCDYVGKGEEIDISIPKRNEIKALVIKAINEISKMNNNQIRNLRRLINNRFNINDLFNTNNLEKIEDNLFKLIENNSNFNIEDFDNIEGFKDILPDELTFETILYCGSLCIYNWILLIMLLPIAIPIIIIIIILAIVFIVIPLIIIVIIYYIIFSIFTANCPL